MGARNPLYWLALFCLGVEEWFINYDVLLMFTGVVAMAAGATVVMAVLLAFAAHGHGMILRQWSYRFGHFREGTERASDWRLFSLATFSLLVVLGSACGSRYAAVMHQMANQPAQNILGPDAMIELNPMRDVLLSLLWNVMAWAAGVFVAYLVHDRDPDYMDATYQYHLSSRAYHRARQPLNDKLKTIEARHQRAVEGVRNTAPVRAKEVAAERNLLEQVEPHEEALVTSASATRGAANVYHSAPAQLAVSQRGALVIERSGGKRDRSARWSSVRKPCVSTTTWSGAWWRDMRVAAILILAGLAPIVPPGKPAWALFDSYGLDPSFCQQATVRQTVVYIDDMMMADGQTGWATRLAVKLEATLVPGERVTIVSFDCRPRAASCRPSIAERNVRTGSQRRRPAGSVNNDHRYPLFCSICWCIALISALMS